MNLNNKILIAAGGTGGHIFPALSIINQIKVNDYIIITDKRGENYFNNFFSKKKINYKIFVHKVSSPSSKILTIRLKSLYQLLISLLKTFFLILSNKPDIIVGFGGYPSVAPIIAAKIFKIPSIIHEQNAIIGRANKLLSKISNLLALSFLETKYIEGNQNLIFTGNPTRKEFNNLRKSIYSVPIGIQKFKILIVGGSLGANFFSEEVTSIICSLPKELRTKIHIIQQVNKEDKGRIKDLYHNHLIDCEIESFFDNIFLKFKKAHLVITRSGGSSVAEILISGRPVIFIPLPTSLDDHQSENTKLIINRAGGWALNQNTEVDKDLKKLLESLINNPRKLIIASNNIKKLSKDLQVKRQNKSASEFFSDVLINLINSNKKKPSKLC
ncbi:UDP-N-acetylglucosamine--N-acetylmuramyl-(pentapeptide) pyrophosphoryl-undecaprenol N-acetylglucosamine transferase [Alphaproteobacteria bacterium]|nr:UDP-N-acetylglucosamine--N-acetylmuramyl-(pentapeptide) pyrophosphoryl-undecaprenol N-acetylglucosamine transferase [Alphaproteobacteria bacterium]